MLRTADLTKIYDGGTRGVLDLNLRVAAGQIYCLLGANGAGKSTTINLFLNFIKPTRGAAYVEEVEVAENPIAARRQLAYVPETVMLYGPLTASQNLRFFASLAERRLQGTEEEGLLNGVGLERSAWRRRVADFSKGMRQKLALAIALARGAQNLLLDEPTSGLDPKASHDLMAMLCALRDGGKSILISTHDVFRAKEIADCVGIMKEGRLVADMRREDMAGKDLQGIYLDYMEGAEASGD